VKYALVVFILVAFVFADPAAAQNWQEYSYPNYSFRVRFRPLPQPIARSNCDAEDKHGRKTPA